MSGDSKREWNEDMQPGALGHLLERMSTQFTPNPGSVHYDSGFIPAASPPWPSHLQTSFSQHPHGIALDSSLSQGALTSQIELNSLHSYSARQDAFPEIEEGRTPLLRSSSDLGIRMSNYQTHSNSFINCQLDGIMDHHVESLGGTLFYQENASVPLQISNCTSYHHHPHLETNKIMENQNMQYNTFITATEALPPSPDEQTNKFSTKLSNFTSSIGTWFSPLDQLRTSYCSNTRELCEDSKNKARPHENLVADMCSVNVDSTLIKNMPHPNCHKEVKPPVVTKPSYSDVLSKTPSLDGKSLSMAHSLNKGNIEVGSILRSRGELSQRPNNKSNKTRNNPGNGGSNSPNSNANNDFMAPDWNINTKQNSCLKLDSSNSKVGLDDFDLPENISGFANSLNNNLNTPKTCINDNAEKNKKRSSLTSEELSPGHHPRKGNKNDCKRLADKMEESPNSSDAEKIHADKLNNHKLTTQLKQTPKRTVYINNNLTSIPVGSSPPSKTSNADSFSNTAYRKLTVTKEESRLQYDNSSICSSNKPLSSCNISSVSSSTSCTVGNSSVRIGGLSSRGSRSSNAGKSERGKEGQAKRNIAKKKKDSTPYFQSDVLMTGWAVCLIWLRMTANIGLWLITLVLDVVQMSSRLFIHFSFKFYENGKHYLFIAQVAIHSYWLKVVSYFSQRKTDNKRPGRSDRKFPSGLESNIPLPTTGEEAMKRLLACRGKDPYSILGVTQLSTDDDIKKYYKRQAFLVHPDKNKQPGAEEAFKILAHAFEIIGEPERRNQYDTKLAEEVHFEGATGELASLLKLLKEKLEEAANTIRCTNCNKRHRRVKLQRPTYAARHCAECQIRHAAREGDIWAESWYMGIRWKYFACMEGAIYDISEWAACQRDNLKHLQANTHSVQYRIVSGKKNSGGKNAPPECPTDPELEDFFNNLCRERFGQDFVPSTSQSGSQQSAASDARKRRGKKKK